MLEIKVPEFKYDFFDDRKSNAALCSITYHPSEITPMIQDYFDYHTGTHPVCQPIIQLLRQLKIYTYCFDSIFIDQFTDKRYQEIENDLLNILVQTKQQILSKHFNEADSGFLADALNYACKMITRITDELKQEHPALADKRLTNSPLMRWLASSSK